MKLLIKGARVIDPENNIDGIREVLVKDGVVIEVAPNLAVDVETVIDASGRIVMPGLVDMHVHLREPGREDKETVLSGTQAAAKGGVTSLVAMPNTNPVIDSSDRVKSLQGIIERDAKVNVFIAAAISRDRIGKELTDIKNLKEAGVLAITDDGDSVDDPVLMLEAFKRASKENVLVICHCEDKALNKSGVVNLGFTSTRLGLRGIPRESEYLRVARDIELAQKAGARIHIAHVSCKESLDIIAEAKRKDVKVTAETAPHYFSLTEDDILGYDTNKKMSPPLRSQEDVIKIKEALKDGTIDLIASDHAPHTENEKDIEFDRAAFGVTGLETMLAVAATELLSPGTLDWPDLARLLSLNPARILNLKAGTLTSGMPADIIVVDPDAEWVVERSSFVSQSKNSCFLGKKVKSKVVCTIQQGKVIYRTQDNSFVAS